MKKEDLLEVIAAVRHFNRFYTKHIGVLNEGLLESPFTLTEARIIYELANRERATATELGNELGMDLGYLSRTLRALETRKVITRKTSAGDARRSFVALTAKGRREFESLDRLSRNQIEEILNDVTPLERKRLLSAMALIENILAKKNREETYSYVLRSPEPGDMGWVVQSNGTLYAHEYGWDVNYEALVAKIVADFVKNLDPKKERCWIAEKDGENVGSVFLVKESDDVARLRLLIVDPKARGLGIGKRLVDECTRFARRAGYKKITLWTNSVLLAARSLYQKAGYKLAASESHHNFGHDLVGETWELTL